MYETGAKVRGSSNEKQQSYFGFSENFRSTTSDFLHFSCIVEYEVKVCRKVHKKGKEIRKIDAYAAWLLVLYSMAILHFSIGFFNPKIHFSMIFRAAKIHFSMIFRAAKIHFSNELAKFLNQILLFLRIIIYLRQMM